MANKIYTTLTELNFDFLKRFTIEELRTPKGGFAVEEFILDVCGIPFEIRAVNSAIDGISLSFKSEAVWNSDNAQVRLDLEDNLEFVFSASSFAVNGKNTVKYLQNSKAASSLTMMVCDFLMTILELEGLEETLKANREVYFQRYSEKKKEDEQRAKRILEESKLEFDNKFELALADEKARNKVIRQMKSLSKDTNRKVELKFAVSDAEFKHESLPITTITFDGDKFTASRSKDGEFSNHFFFSGKRSTTANKDVAELLEFAVIKKGDEMFAPQEI